MNDMRDFINTVSAENQMIASSEVSFLGNASADLKILVVGNSITRHGPKADIGWPYDWGMAASAPEKDYVHRLYAILRENGIESSVYVRQSAYWERNFLEPNCLLKFEEARAFDTDILVFRLGENVPNENVRFFKEAIENFVTYLCPHCKQMIFTTCFWKSPEKEQAIREAAEYFCAPCIDITCTDSAMTAKGLFERAGVAGHPGDVGMEMIAQKISQELLSLLKK